MNSSNELQNRIDRKIASAKVAHMNDSKWRKLFNALVEQPEGSAGMRIKFVNDKRLLATFETLGPYAADETRFRDEMPSPYAPFREIEFLLIPKSLPSLDRKRRLPDFYNDLAALITYLDGVAKFSIQTCEDGSIKILAYEWNT